MKTLKWIPAFAGMTKRDALMKRLAFEIGYSASHERISHCMGFKDSGIKILKRGIMIGGAVTRSLIGIGAAATLIYAAFKKKKGHGGKKDSIG